MSEQERQRLLLVMLAVLLVIAAIRLWPSSDTAAPVSPWDAVLDDSEDGDTPRRGSRRGRDDASTDPRDMPVEVLNLAALEPEVGSHTIGRNPWDYYVPPPPPPPPRPQPVRTETRVQPPPPPPPRGPNLPRVNVRFLGFFGPEGNPVAVFTDGQEIINARRGDVVGAEFRVDTIGLESVTLKYVRFPDQPPQRLPIGG